MSGQGERSGVAPPLGTGNYTGDTRIGGLYDRNVLNRMQTYMKATDEMELRGLDVQATQLANKYAKEFQTAENMLSERTNSTTNKVRNMFFYDYHKDPRFNEWVAEQQRAREMFHIHWIDESLDSLDRLVRYGIRLFSAVGLAHGVYRTGYLWRTMDRKYAKLHGIGITSVATWEIPIGGIKGIVIGLGVALGCLSGDVLTRLVRCAYNGTTVRPRREWQNVAAAGFGAGAMAGTGLALLGWNALSRTGKGAVFAATTASLGAIGSYLAVYDYKPHVDQYPLPYDDPHHIPWYDRQRKLGGTAPVRGRYTQ